MTAGQAPDGITPSAQLFKIGSGRTTRRTTRRTAPTQQEI